MANGERGVRRLAFYCDESGISGDHQYYGFGALIMQYQRRGQFAQEFRDLAQGRSWGEVKWTKTTKGSFAYHKSLVEHFFRSPYLYFHATVIERQWVDVRQYHDGEWDLALRKHFTQFLASKVKQAITEAPDREFEFRVYVDELPSSYGKADEAMHNVANNMVEQEHPLIEGAHDVRRIKKVYQVDSKSWPEVQLCDLLLGAVLDAWNQKSTNNEKGALKDWIAHHVGWEGLRRATYKKEKKFNIWYLTDSFEHEEDRPVRATPVRLKYPLPRRRNEG